MKDFRCSCIGCGKTPEFGKTEIWVEAGSGMLCESCWRAEVSRSRQTPKDTDLSEHEFCCFCALCKRIPPDPEFKIWIETDKGCICEKCWKEAAGSLLFQKTEPASGEKKGKEPVDVQFGCCQLNKKLLLKALDALAPEEKLEILAENSDVVKEMVQKYAKDKGCTISDINDKNGTCIMTIRRL